MIYEATFPSERLLSTRRRRLYIFLTGPPVLMGNRIVWFHILCGQIRHCHISTAVHTAISETWLLFALILTLAIFSLMGSLQFFGRQNIHVRVKGVKANLRSLASILSELVVYPF